MTAFVISQFGHYPLSFMFQSRSLDDKINYISESELRVTYGDKLHQFQDLFKENIFVCIYQRNIQALVTKMFKVEIIMHQN